MSGVGRDDTSPAAIAVTEKQGRALELRKAGVGLKQIADELGYASESGAREAIRAALQKVVAEPANEMRDLIVARLDELLAGVWEAALSGDPQAIATALKIEERRARLLCLDRAIPTPEKSGENTPKIPTPSHLKVVQGQG